MPSIFVKSWAVFLFDGNIGKSIKSLHSRKKTSERSIKKTVKVFSLFTDGWCCITTFQSPNAISLAKFFDFEWWSESVPHRFEHLRRVILICSPMFTKSPCVHSTFAPFNTHTHDSQLIYRLYMYACTSMSHMPSHVISTFWAFFFSLCAFGI